MRNELDSILSCTPCTTGGSLPTGIPVILLFFLDVFLDDTLCRTGPEKKTEKAMTSPVCHYFKLLFTIFYAMTLASVAPVAWLVLSFLQQQYYTCAYFGPPLADRISTATNATDKCYFKLGFRSKEIEAKKEKAKMYIENLFPKRRRLGGLYSYLKDIGDKVRKEYDHYLDIPPDSHQSTPVDPPQNSPDGVITPELVEEVDGPGETQFENAALL